MSEAVKQMAFDAAQLAIDRLSNDLLSLLVDVDHRVAAVAMGRMLGMMLHEQPANLRPVQVAALTKLALSWAAHLDKLPPAA